MRLTHILNEMVRILNVAEKNDAAKSIAAYLSKGSSRMREGFSKFNKIYEFEYNVFGQQCTMVMTSVSGHLLSLEFAPAYRGWKAVDPIELFDAPVRKTCPPDYEQIKRTLEREIRSCQKLIVWTDCDREGENIGYEVIDVCKAVKQNVDVYRAIFSEITAPAVKRAMDNLTRPNKLVSDAVDARMELDLRIGASFTRFQTLRLQQIFIDLAENLISYGSCQFPTLGFVVERFKERESFISEPFWKIVIAHNDNNNENSRVEFNWDRVRLFDYDACSAIYNLILTNPVAKVVDIQTKPKSKWRPAALDTIELEKSASRKLKINAKETMKIAEKLYTQGLISYPRTETNIFPKELNLSNLIEMQTNDAGWGEFAAGILSNQNYPTPRNGTKSDQAHPPIHPTKYSNRLEGNEKKIYEFIVRHFLACCSKDAKGFETSIHIDVNQEKFSASGLMITERNYLDVYPYEKWSDKEIPVFDKGQVFTPKSIELKEGRTEAPKLLTEADLIALMEKHGIGTDATHAEHIETIKERNYVTLNNQNQFLPAQLGLGLVEGYDSMGYSMAKPHLRAALEEDLKAVCEGRKTKSEVLTAQIKAYRDCFQDARRNVEKLDQAMSRYYGQPLAMPINESMIINSVLTECACKSNVVLKTKKDGNGLYLSCRSYPECRAAVWFPSGIKQATITEEYCENCKPRLIKKMNFKLERGAVDFSIPLDYTTCIMCDDNFKRCLGIDTSVLTTVKRNPNDSTTIRTQLSAPSNRTSGSNSSQQPQSTSRMQSSSVFTEQRRIMSTGSNNSPSSFSSQPSNKQAFRNVTNFENRTRSAVNSNDGDDSNPTVCNCGQPAIQLTVRKDGPNQGRQFFKCAQQQNACDFFLWSDSAGSGSGSGSSTTTSNPSYSSSNSSSANYGNYGASSKSRTNTHNSGNGEALTCNCGNEPLVLTTNKPGPNQGRQFYKCSQSICNFFKWVDDDSSGSNVSAPRTKQSFSSGASSTQGGNDTANKKRKCGVCGEEGHNRKNCPQINN